MCTRYVHHRTYLQHNHCRLCTCAFLDGYCSTVQGLLDWFEVDLGFTHHRTYLRHNYFRVCRCACIFAVCSFALGDKGEGVQTDYAEHLSLGVGGYFQQKERKRCCLVSSLFLTRVGVYVCVCVYTHTQTHCTWGTRCDEQKFWRHQSTSTQTPIF